MMVSMGKKIIPILTLVFVAPLITYAAPMYTVAPLVINLDVEPRDVIVRDITLTNTGTQPVTIFPTVNNISVNEGGQITEFVSRVESDATASLAAWTEVRRSGELLKKGESITIPVTFRIHPSPQPGVYNAFIGFGYGRTVDDAKKMVDEGRAPGVVVTVTYEKTSRQILKLGNFLVERLITSNNNEGVTYTMNNPGDEPLAPSGDIIFYNNRGKEVGAVAVNPDQEVIAPGESRTYSTAVPTDGLLGKYKAFLSIEYGNSQIATVHDTAFFYIFPLKTLFLILIPLLMVAAGIAFLVHRKYLDDADDDDVTHLPVHVRVAVSDAHEHDIDLKKK